MSPGLLLAVSLLAQAYPPWRLDETVLRPDGCGARSELEVALAAQLRREATPPPTPAWSVSLVEDGPQSLRVLLRGPDETLRLSRSLVLEDASCADLIDAVAFMVERYLRDVDWPGTTRDASPAEVLPASPVLRPPSEEPAEAPPVPDGPLSSSRPLWLHAGFGARQSVAFLPTAGVGVTGRMSPTILVSLDLSVPLRPARIEVAGLGNQMFSFVPSRSVVVWPWALRLAAGRAWQRGAGTFVLGPDVMLGLDFGRGEQFPAPVSASRLVWSGGLVGGAAWPLGSGVSVGATAFVNVTLWSQPFTVQDEMGGSATVAPPTTWQAGFLVELSLSLFS